jgi:glucose uptake protein GlcU
MKDRLLDNYIPLFLSVLTMTAGLYKWRQMNLPGRLILVGILISTAMGVGSMIDSSPSMIHFSILVGSDLVSFIFDCIIFHYAVPVFRKYNIALFTGIAGFLWWLGCLIFFRYIPHASVARFESFHSLCFLVLAFFAIYFLLRDGEWAALQKDPVFWIIVIGLFSTSTTFVYDISYEILARNEREFWMAAHIMMFSQYFVDIAYCFVFLLYPKKIAPSV